MPPPRLQVIAATPGSANLRDILGIKSKTQVIVTAFGGGRFRSLRDLIGDGEGNIELLEFGALVGRVLSIAGGTASGLPSRGHVEAAVSMACESLDERSVFTRSALTPGFQELATSCLDTLRSHGMESEELASLAAAAPGPLADKLSGLASIQGESARLLGQLGKRFNSHRIRQCLEIDFPVPLSVKVVVLAGSDDDPLNLEWVRWAAEYCTEVTVIVDAPPVAGSLFEGGAKIVEALGLEPSRLVRANALTAKLFANEPFPGTPSELEVHIFAMPDPLAECEWTLRAALTDIANGIPAENIAIVARRMEEYAPLIEASARRLGVPISLSRTVPLLANGVARFIADLIDALGQRTPTALARMVRRSYFRVPAHQLPTLSAGFARARSAPTDPWGVLHQFASEIEADLPWLGRLLEWRRVALAENRNLSGWIDHLKDLGQLPWLMNVFEGHEPTEVRDRYAMNLLQRSLAEVASVERVRSDSEVSYATFVRRSRKRWEVQELTLPSALDGVAVVSSAAEIGLADSVYVLGLLEGVFPRRRSENAILNDDDLAWISAQRGTTLPDSHRRAREERDEFMRVCSSPSRRLVLSYPLAGEERDNVKAFYLTQVEQILGIEPKTVARTSITPEEPISEADVQLSVALAEPDRQPLDNDLATESAQALVRRRPREAYKISDLRRVLTCPFHYMANRLGIRANRPQSRWNRLLSLPRLVALPAAENEEIALRMLSEKLEELLEDLSADAQAEDINLIRLGGKRMIREWVDREFEARRLWKREAAEPDPEHGQQLRGSFKWPNDEPGELTGRYAGLSTRGNHRVLNLFMGHDPERIREDKFHERLEEGDRFELGLTLISMGNASGVGLEVDHPTGRRLILHPRPIPAPDMLHGFAFSSFDEADRREWRDFVHEQMKVALARTSRPETQATPGSHCEYCDMGELCRRAQMFSEADNPFEADPS